MRKWQTHNLPTFLKGVQIVWMHPRSCASCPIAFCLWRAAVHAAQLLCIGSAIQTYTPVHSSKNKVPNPCAEHDSESS